MYLAESRMRAIVEVDLGDLPHVCSNVRFVHNVLAATAHDARGHDYPRPHTYRGAGPLELGGAAPRVHAARHGMN